MLKSMTAYGRGVFTAPIGQFTVEIQSVNRKHLDIQVLLPRELGLFEMDIKKWLSAAVARGQISVKVFVTYQGQALFNVRPNLPLARQLKEAWVQIADDLQVDSGGFNLSLLRGTTDLFLFEESREGEENYRKALKEAFDQAFKGFLQMKGQEGAVLQKDMAARLSKLQKEIKLIESKTSDATNRHREKLIARLEELLPGKIENEERILREVALYAEKIDIAEEIVRFNCHLKHFDELFNSNEPSIGKTLEFIVQELNREANTIGSKSSEIEISRSTIEIKSELERIREQIQNIE